jgi:hypothetical protein
LLLEGEIDVKELLGRHTLSLTLGSFLTLEVVLVLFLAQWFGRLPLFVLLCALVWCTGFLETKVGELLLGLLGQVVGIGFAVVFWLCLLLRDGLATLGDGDGLCVLVPSFISTCIPSAFFDFFGGDGLTGLFVSEFTLSGWLTPTMTLLLGMIGNSGTAMTVTTSARSRWSTTRSANTRTTLTTRLVSKTICALAGRLLAVVVSARGTFAESSFTTCESTTTTSTSSTGCYVGRLFGSWLGCIALANSS